jgi:4-amino-4-deoxy-L-arabinose transferase-like glycosyltransferase
MSRKSIEYTSLLIILTGAAFFLPFLGAVHLFDWDEINFAESAREMIGSGNLFPVFKLELSAILGEATTFLLAAKR